MITGEKILVSGVTGSVASPLAVHLAADNEVWGIARFAGGDDRQKEQFTATATTAERFLSRRDELEAAGVRTVPIDLAGGDLDALPTDFTYVLHLAWMRADLAHLDDAIRTNVEGPGLLLQHCRAAKAALVMSGMGIYSPNDDPWHAYSESDPIGRASSAYAPTSPASKLGVESVARYCARAFDLPVVITRLNTFMGTTGSFPAMHIAAVLEGREMIAPCDPNPHTPIHTDDMKDQLEALLDAASTPANIVNWCGDENVTVQDWMSDAAAWSGRPARLRVEHVPGAPAGTVSDPSKRRSITGPCRTRFDVEYRKLYDQMTAPVGGAR